MHAQRGAWLLLVTLAGCGPSGGSSDAASGDGGTDGGASVDASTLADGEDDAFASPDAAARCAYGGGCDLRGQDCASTEACVPGARASLCTSAGAAAVGEACAAVADCVAGAVCAPDGHCAPLACAPSDCTIPRWVYVPLADTTGAPLPSGVGVCLLEGTCSPVPNDCPSGEQCWPASDGSASCLAAGTGGEGSACTGSSDCVPGTGCVTIGAGGPHCARFCRLGGTDCPATATCTDAGWPTFGLCA